MFSSFRTRRPTIPTHSRPNWSCSGSRRQGVLIIVTLNTAQSFNTSDLLSILRQSDSTVKLGRVTNARGVSSLASTHETHALAFGLNLVQTS